MANVQLNTRFTSVKTAYEGNPDRVPFTPEDKARLDSIEVAATANFGALADLDAVSTSEIANSSVTLQKLNFSGTASSATYLRGDGVWATITGGVAISDVGYGPGWNGSASTAPSQNAVYDKFEEIDALLSTAVQPGGVQLSDPNADRIFFWDDSTGSTAFLQLGTNLSISGTTLNAAGGGGSVDDTAYADTWDGVTDEAPSKNAVYDIVSTFYDSDTDALSAATVTATSGQIAAPAGDRIFFYDQSAGTTQLLELGTNLSITGTTLDASSEGGTGALADLDTVGTSQIDDDSVTVAKISATGTADGTTFLSGDGSWKAASGSGLADVVDDTSPQLGGNLDLNSFSVGDADAGDLTKLSELTATSTELNYVDGVTSAIQTQMDAKAALASPTFTGTPAAPTATGGTNTTQLATTAFVQSAVTSLIDGAPAGLNTLNELAAAIGDDASYASTVTSALADKAPLASPTFTGTPAAPNASGGANTTQIATTAFVQSELADYALLDDPDLTGTPTAPTASQGTDTTQIATTAYVQGEIGTSIQAYDADTLKSDTSRELTVGYTADHYNQGTVSGGTFTPNALTRSYFIATNNGAHTLAAPSTTGGGNNCTVVIRYTNGSSAGTITFSGFEYVENQAALTTVDDAKFIITIVKVAGQSFASVMKGSA